MPARAIGTVPPVFVTGYQQTGYGDLQRTKPPPVLKLTTRENHFDSLPNPNHLNILHQFYTETASHPQVSGNLYRSVGGLEGEQGIDRPGAGEAERGQQ